MIIRMARLSASLRHRLRDLVQRTRDATIATNLRVPRSTARGWLRKAPTVVVSLDVIVLKESELRQEVLELRRRVKEFTALLRLAVAVLRSSGFTLTHERLPDGGAKTRVLRAVDRAREFVPWRTLLRSLRLSPSRFHAWRRRQHACALDDQSSCPHTSLRQYLGHGAPVDFRWRPYIRVVWSDVKNADDVAAYPEAQQFHTRIHATGRDSFNWPRQGDTEIEAGAAIALTPMARDTVADTTVD
jgi:hypothetical protein